MKLKNPLISIIIPIYNKEKYIKQCIESVLNQTYTNFEVVFIDDGSTDKSASIVEIYSNEKRIKYFHQKNSGVSSARNLGLNKALGEFIVFLDADDTMVEKFLEKMLKEANASTVVCCAHNKININNGQTLKSKVHLKKDVLLSFLLNRVDINTNCWLIPVDLISTYNLCFDEDLKWGEDMLFFTKVLVHAKNTAFLEDPLTNYYIEISDSLSSFKVEKMEQDVIWIDRAILFLKAKNVQKVYIDALRHYRLPALIIYGLYYSKPKLSSEEYLVYKSKYMKHTKKLRFNNGLRSLKALVYKMKL